MEYETGISTSLDVNDVKRYLDEVLIELKNKKNKNSNHQYVLEQLRVQDINGRPIRLENSFYSLGLER